MCILLLISLHEGTHRPWVGKLFRRKAAFSPFVPLKAAVKVNLPIRTLYVAWLWTTVI